MGNDNNGGQGPVYRGSMEVPDPHLSTHAEKVSYLTASYLEHDGCEVVHTGITDAGTCHIAIDSDEVPTLVSVIEAPSFEAVEEFPVGAIVENAIQRLAMSCGLDVPAFVSDVASTTQLAALFVFVDDETKRARLRHVKDIETPAIRRARESIEPPDFARSATILSGMINGDVPADDQEHWHAGELINIKGEPGTNDFLLGAVTEYLKSTGRTNIDPAVTESGVCVSYIEPGEDRVVLAGVRAAGDDDLPALLDTPAGGLAAIKPLLEATGVDEETFASLFAKTARMDLIVIPPEPDGTMLRIRHVADVTTPKLEQARASAKDRSPWLDQALRARNRADGRGPRR